MGRRQYGYIARVTSEKPKGLFFLLSNGLLRYGGAAPRLIFRALHRLLKYEEET